MPTAEIDVIYDGNKALLYMNFYAADHGWKTSWGDKPLNVGDKLTITYSRASLSEVKLAVADARKSLGAMIVEFRADKDTVVIDDPCPGCGAVGCDEPHECPLDEDVFCRCCKGCVDYARLCEKET